MIRNVHQREIPASAAAAGALLESLASPEDRLWRTRLVAPMQLDRGLEPGSAGGHGPVRYRVIAHVPGTSVVFRFDPGVGLAGSHRFEVFPARHAQEGTAPGSEERVVLRHVLEASLTGIGHLIWPTVVRPMHDAAIEDIFDHAERELTGSAPAHPHVAPLWIRALGPRLRRRRVASALPAASSLAALDRIDAADRWVTPLLPGDSRDPALWAGAILAGAVPGVTWLLRLRDALVRPLGLQTMPATLPATGFPLLAERPGEVVTGIDDKHLSFRVRILLDDDMVATDTSVRLNGRPGRAYWAVVRHFHPHVIRAMVAAVPIPLKTRPRRFAKSPETPRGRPRPRRVR